ncbi:MAG: hypothetical protein ABH843_01095 [Candidatus Omnitrophota bacterium]
MERSLQKMPPFNKTYSDGKGDGPKSKKSYKKYSKPKTKMEVTCAGLDRRNACEAFQITYRRLKDEEKEEKDNKESG